MQTSYQKDNAFSAKTEAVSLLAKMRCEMIKVRLLNFDF